MLGASQLLEHLAAHPESLPALPNDGVQAPVISELKSQPVPSANVGISDRQQEPKGENIEQVLRDLEELVDRDLTSNKLQGEEEKQASNSLPEVDQMAQWPNNSIAFPDISYPGIQHLPNDMSDPSNSSTWLVHNVQTNSPSLGPVSPPRSTLRSTPYKRGGGQGGGQGVGQGGQGQGGGQSGQICSSRGGGEEVACGQCGWMFDNANFLQLHRVLMHSRRRETKVLEHSIILTSKHLKNLNNSIMCLCTVGVAKYKTS